MVARGLASLVLLLVGVAAGWYQLRPAPILPITAEGRVAGNISGVAIALAGPTMQNGDGLTYPGVNGSEGAIEQLRASGVGLVRIVVQPRALMQGATANRAQAQNQVLHLVRVALDNHMQTIIDIHPWWPDTPADEAKLVCDQATFSQLKATEVSLAEKFAQIKSGWLALELLNEPKVCPAGAGVRWEDRQKDLVAAISATAPNLNLVVTPAKGQLDDLLAFDPRPYLANPRILFSFHFYDPFIFTTPGYYGLRDAPFPPSTLQSSVPTVGPSPDNRSDAIGAAMASPRSDTRRDMRRYIESDWTQQTVRDRFRMASAWQGRWGLNSSRIFVGEFGVIRDNGTFPPYTRVSELLWLSTVRAAARDAGFRSSYWIWPTHASYDADAATGKLRQDVAGAVGLKPLGVP